MRLLIGRGARARTALACEKLTMTTLSLTPKLSLTPTLSLTPALTPLCLSPRRRAVDLRTLTPNLAPYITLTPTIPLIPTLSLARSRKPMYSQHICPSLLEPPAPMVMGANALFQTILEGHHELTLNSYRDWQMKRAQTSALSLPCISESERPAWCCVVLSRQVSAVRAGELRDLARLWGARSQNH